MTWELLYKTVLILSILTLSLSLIACSHSEKASLAKPEIPQGRTVNDLADYLVEVEVYMDWCEARD